MTLEVTKKDDNTLRWYFIIYIKTFYRGFIRQFKEGQILKVKNAKYGVQKRYFKVGIGFEIEID